MGAGFVIYGYVKGSMSRVCIIFMDSSFGSSDECFMYV